MYEIPLILGVVGIFALIIIIFNIFFIYQPILKLNSEIEAIKAEIKFLSDKFAPQIQLLESLLSGT